MRRAANKQPVLKSQDLFLLLVLLAYREQAMTYPEMSACSGLSVSEVHGALKRAELARLLAFVDKRPSIIMTAFKEFLLYGARYAFPALRGGLVGGIPTAYAVAPLNASIVASNDPPPVWPSADGTVRGIALIPLYPTAPAAALRSPALYEFLALFDALRMGSARERNLALKLLEERL